MVLSCSHNKKIFYYFMLNYAGTTTSKTANDTRQARDDTHAAAVRYPEPIKTGSEPS